jgi:hypothetical protein
VSAAAGVYYLPRSVPEADLAIMRRLDRLHLEYPFAGSEAPDFPRQRPRPLPANPRECRRFSHTRTKRSTCAIRQSDTCPQRVRTEKLNLTSTLDEHHWTAG